MYFNLWESFDDDVKNVLERSKREAQKHLNELIEPVHILLALLYTYFEILKNSCKIDVEPIIKDLTNRIDEELNKTDNVYGSKASLQSNALMDVAFKFKKRDKIGIGDLLKALMAHKEEFPCQLLTAHKINTDKLVKDFYKQTREMEIQKELIEARYGLPPYLRQFADNFNLLARQDQISPIIGRDKELRQICEVLCHVKTSNSIMLIGEPGVGKTGIAEELARRIEFGSKDIPAKLKKCQVINLNINSMVAGTMLRGMFEDRMQNVLREVSEHPEYVVFIDEVHCIRDAGSALGAPNDAAQILKSALSKGKIRIIGATTPSEYKQYFQEDEALAKRFRNISISEPTMEETREMLIKIKSRFRDNYSIEVKDDAIETALEMSSRYARHLRCPDKPISWLDTASVRAEIEGRKYITSGDVMDVIADFTKMPKNMVSRNVSDQLKDICRELSGRVIGQDEAKEAIQKVLVVNKGPLKENFNRPDGVLLFLGPTGVGKTELAKALAEFLFGDEKKMIRIDFGEFQDESSVSKLIGSPRGYSGAERGGMLTNGLMDNPYTVVLLDEVEKAHPKILNTLLAAFDEGWIADGRGKRAYLSDAIVIMTSNLGSEHFKKLSNPLGFASSGSSGEHKEIKIDVMKELRKKFSPEFINRIDEVVVFNPLTKEEVRRISEYYLDGVKSKLAKKGKKLVIDAPVWDVIVKEGYSLAYGARHLKRYIKDKIDFPISKNFGETKTFHISVNEKGEIIVDFFKNGSGKTEKVYI